MVKFASKKELIRPATRRAFREHLVEHSVLRKIENYFDDAGVEQDLNSSQDNTLGQRRQLVESYYATVDWCDRTSVQRVLHAYQDILNDFLDKYESELEADRNHKTHYSKLVSTLERDGLQWENRQLNIPSNVPHLDLVELKRLTNDDKVIEQHLDRIGKAIPEDPAQVIGSSKELVESVCRMILVENEKTPTISNEKFPALIRRTRKTLNLLPEDVAGKPKVQDAAKRVLGGLGSIVDGLNTIRNEMGTGHGRETAQKLPVRYAYLASDAAFTFCRFVLETQKSRKED